MQKMFLNNRHDSCQTGFTVRIKDLEVYARHGVNNFEQEMGQIFLLDITMRTPDPADLSDDPIDSAGSGIEDSIENTVNYSYVCRHVTKWMKENTCQLIETVADSLCREILENFKAVEYVCVEVKKPHAPIKEAHFDYVSVKKEMAWHDAYLSLGSNSPDREQKMEEAMDKIKNIQGIRSAACSTIRSYPAVGAGYEGIFLNNAVYIRTCLSPDKLHAACRRVETELGRHRETEGGTRPIDIDILLYDDLISSGGNYILPYPDLENRLYVLEPMCELAPRLRHPLLYKTMTELLAAARQ